MVKVKWISSSVQLSMIHVTNKLPVDEIFARPGILRRHKNSKETTFNISTAWKVSKYGVFSGPYFSAFGLNTDDKKLRIWTLST